MYLKDIIDPSLMTQVESYIEQNEGFKADAYLDTSGRITIGYGRDVQDNPLTLDEWNEILPNGITTDQATDLMSNAINSVLEWLSTYKWWDSLTDNRKIALIDMAYALGKTHFLGFPKMILAVATGNYNEAATQMKNSHWYSQEPNRVDRDANLMLNG